MYLGPHLRREVQLRGQPEHCLRERRGYHWMPKLEHFQQEQQEVQRKVRWRTQLDHYLLAQREVHREVHSMMQLDHYLRERLEVHSRVHRDHYLRERWEVRPKACLARHSPNQATVHSAVRSEQPLRSHPAGLQVHPRKPLAIPPKEQQPTMPVEQLSLVEPPETGQDSAKVLAQDC
jgi:hypothetical protein